MKKKLLLSLVISITVLLAGGSVMFFLSCAGEGGDETPAVGKLYIGGYVQGVPGKGYIYVMGAGTKDLITTIEIPVDGAKPDWLTLSPDEKKLYCSDQSSSRVYIIDTETDTYENFTTVYTGPKGIAFTPDGTKALVGCNTEVCLIDVATGSHNLIDDWVSTLYQVAGIEVHPTNNRWYAAMEKTAASYLGAIGYGDVELSSVSYVEDVTTEKLMDITLSSDGNKLYTSEWSQNRIILGTIDLSGIPFTAGEGINTTDSEVYYETIALTPDDSKLYISRMCVSRIDYLETTSPSLTSTIDYGGSGNVTMDIALSDDGSTVFVLAKYPVGVDSINACRIIVINTADDTVAGTVDVGEFEPISIAYKKP